MSIHLALFSAIICYFVVDETNAIVVDLGTSQCRFGTAGQDVPRHNFSSVRISESLIVHMF